MGFPRACPAHQSWGWLGVSLPCSDNLLPAAAHPPVLPAVLEHTKGGETTQKCTRSGTTLKSGLPRFRCLYNDHSHFRGEDQTAEGGIRHWDKPATHTLAKQLPVKLYSWLQQWSCWFTKKSNEPHVPKFFLWKGRIACHISLAISPDCKWFKAGTVSVWAQYCQVLATGVTHHSSSSFRMSCNFDMSNFVLLLLTL